MPSLLLLLLPLCEKDPRMLGQDNSACGGKGAFASRRSCLFVSHTEFGGKRGGGAFKVGPKVRGKGGGKGKGGREPAMGSRPEVRVSACGTGRGPGVGEGKGALV